jgi:hypothetical protein
MAKLLGPGKPARKGEHRSLKIIGIGGNRFTRALHYIHVVMQAQDEEQWTLKLSLAEGRQLQRELDFILDD